MAGTHAPVDILALSVHGPAGVVDLVVPASATAGDVAAEYARQAGLGSPPLLRTRLGRPVGPGVGLARAGLGPGALLVADPGPPAPPVPGRHAARMLGAGRPGPAPVQPGALSALWLVLAAGAASVAAWCAATAPAGGQRTASVGLLVVATAVGVLPVGRLGPQRVVAAPAFAGAAALVVAWDPHDVRLPMVLGVTGLAAALAAAVGRALAPRPEEALWVWILAGSTVFAVTGLGALGGAPPRLVWAVLLVGALLAARFVPTLAVYVPDQYLIDLERLAATAWSAREQPTGRRGRSVVPREAIGAVALRGTRIVTAASAAVLVVSLLAAPLLLATATLPVDRIGARVLVGCAGAGLLLAARSYRHSGARTLLRVAGLGCGSALGVVLLSNADADGVGRWVGVGAVVVAAVLVVAAVAVGRGWRSAWWSRRAEVAEGLAGAVAVAALVVAAGWSRELWELASLWELGS